MKPKQFILLLASGGLLLWAGGEACGPDECSTASAAPAAPGGPAAPEATAASFATAVFQVEGLKKTASGAT